ncbi:unnamed protein product [Fusarium graminearum]|nr:unnamed protein product [Fusarium graminearum]
MCNQRTEKWVCKHCEKPVKEVTYLTSKCKSQSETDVCKEAGKTCYETIDIHLRLLIPTHYQDLPTQTIQRFWEKKSKKNVCESVKKGGICTQASPTLLDYVYVADADCEICKQMNQYDDEKVRAGL